MSLRTSPIDDAVDDSAQGDAWTPHSVEPLAMGGVLGNETFAHIEELHKAVVRAEAEQRFGVQASTPRHVLRDERAGQSPEPMRSPGGLTDPFVAKLRDETEALVASIAEATLRDAKAQAAHIIDQAKREAAATSARAFRAYEEATSLTAEAIRQAEAFLATAEHLAARLREARDTMAYGPPPTESLAGPTLSDPA
jgi:hypothetical protein